MTYFSSYGSLVELADLVRAVVMKFLAVQSSFVAIEIKEVLIVRSCLPTMFQKPAVHHFCLRYSTLSRRLESFFGA